MWHYFPSSPLLTEFTGYAPANLSTVFHKNAYVLTKKRNNLVKLPATSRETNDISWNQLRNNRYFVK